MSGGFDVALALRRIVTGFARDFTPIVVLGFGMVTLPEIAQALAGTNAGSTVVATLAGLFEVLFVVIVSHGALARIAGSPVPAHRFAGAGLAASPRALSPALLLGVAVVLALVLLLLAGLAGPAALAVRAGVVVAAFAGAVLTVAAIPLALSERVTPVAALVLSAALTQGRRGGVAIVVGLVALTIVPARLVLAAAVDGLGPAATGGAAALARPGLWLFALFDLLAWGVAAVVPAAVYVGLVESER